jgi:predicted NBD/HSP70 family sugar kinase
LFVKNINKVPALIIMAKKRYQSVNHKLMRELNISLILSHLRTRPSQTRADLAVQTGLTRSTVTNLVDELVDRGFVCETGLVPSQGGRPGTTLELNPSAGCAIAVEFRIDTITCLLTDFVGKPRQREQIQIDVSEPYHAIQQAEELIGHLLSYNAAGNATSLLGIGVGIGGMINVREGSVQFVSNLPQWRNIALKALWTERYDLPVYLGNEAQIAALGEKYFGAARGYSDLIFLDMVGYGIGAGIVINGRLFQGSDGYAGEVGHTMLDRNGPPCPCGRQGCWETLVATLLDDNKLPDPWNSPTRRWNLIALNSLLAAFQAGDEAAHQTLLQISQITASGISNLINVFNPELIVLGGELGLTLESFLPVMKTQIDQQALPPNAGAVKLQTSQLGTDTCLMGAAALVLDEILREPFWQASLA